MTEIGAAYGMGNRVLGDWKRCDEKKIGSCNEETDGCCAVVPCVLCISLFPYGEDASYGKAEYTSGEWIGTIAGLEFVAWFERNYDGECEFVITLAGTEVVRVLKCDPYSPVSCRSPSGSVDVAIDYVEGVLEWDTYESLEVDMVVDPDTLCKVPFCGTCTCTCECLCVTLDPASGEGATCAFELCNTAYSCDPPLWSGEITCGYTDYFLEFALEADQYTGQCLLAMSVDGEFIEYIEVGDCGAISATITLPNYAVITVSCKKCSCEPVAVYQCECRLDILATSGATAEAELGECDKEPGGEPTTTPTENRAWNEEDCYFAYAYPHIINAFPPNCNEGDPDVFSKRVVFVQKLSENDAPFINNSLVEIGEWYAVVYKVNSDEILGIYYDYDICCINENPNDAATSHLAWIRFTGVVLGSIPYSILVYNVTTAAEYGNCGLPAPF